MLTRANAANSTVLFVLLVGSRIISTTNGADDNGHKITSYLTKSTGEGNKLRIWRVEEGKIVATNESNYSKFQSSGSYIVQEANSKVSSDNWRTFYWIGKSASEEDASDAAYHAVLQDRLLHFLINVHKEAEGYESSIFKGLFKSTSIEEEAEQRSIFKVIEDEVNNDVKRMFVIREPEKNYRYFKEVNPKWDYSYIIRADCVVLISETIYVHCGSTASEKQRSGAEALAEIISKKKNLDKKPIVIHRKPVYVITPEEQNKLASFLLELSFMSEADQTRQIVERVDEFTPAELRRILGQTEVEKDGSEWFDINIYRIYEDYPFILKPNQKREVCEKRLPVFPKQHTPLDVLNTKDCFIVDSCSNAGLFVWMGALSKKTVRSESARKAELLLRRRTVHNYATPVTYIDQRAVPKSVQTLQNLVRFLEPLKYVKRLRLK